MAFKNKSRRHFKNFKRQSSFPNQRNVIDQIHTCHQSLALGCLEKLQQSPRSKRLRIQKE